MSRQRLMSLVVAALLVLAAALYVASQRNTSRDVQGLALYPTLGADMASVVAVTVRKGGMAGVATPDSGAPGGTTPGGVTPGALTIHKTGDLWTVAERGDYPADLVKLRKLLNAMSEAKILEEKTSDPARYAVLGVQDVAQAGGTGTAAGGGTEITVSEKDKKLSLIVGKAAGEGSFVRRAGEKPSYSVEPAISVETEARYWIDSRLIDVPTQHVQSIEVKPADGPPYVLRRSTPAKPGGTPPGAKASDGAPGVATPGGDAHDGPFSLDAVPAGRTALDASALAPAPTLFTALTAEDVAAATELDFSHPAQAVVTLTDGAVMTLTGIAVGGKHWLEVRFPTDAALEARAHGRAFEIASYRYEAIFKPLEQLLTPKPAPVSRAPAASTKPHASPGTAPATP